MYAAFRSFFITVIASLLVACGGGGGNDAPTTGTFTLGLTDAPIDEIYELNVKLTGATIKPQNGPPISQDFDPPINVDLMTLTGGNVVNLLDGWVVDTGRYNWLELHADAEIDGVPDSYVMETKNGGMTELRIPSGSSRFVSGFVITAGQNNVFTLDWDVRRALTNPVGLDGYHLGPAHRLIDMTEYGSLSGIVENALVMHSSCTSDAEGNGNVVYLYSGHDASPDDLGSAGAPLSSAPVQQDETMTGAYTYTFSFLDPGDYTVAFTCQGLDDNSDTDETGVDEIAFGGQVNATVAGGQDTSNEAPTIQ